MESNENAQSHQIYVAPLAAYSSGHDTGRWIEVTKCEDELKEKITELLDDCPYSAVDGDWRIHDYQGFYDCGCSLGEHPSLKDLAEFMGLIEQHGKLVAELLDYFCGDVEEAKRYLDKKYLGAFDSAADYAEKDALGKIQGEIPVVIAAYVNYEAMGRDLLLGGEILAIELLDAEDRKIVHIFTNRPTN